MARRKDPNIGCLYFLIALPLAIILLPLKLAGDILKAERRSRNKRKGRRR